MAGDRLDRTYFFVPGVPGGPATWEPLVPFCPDSARVIYWPLEHWQCNDPDSSDELDRLETSLRNDIGAIAGPVTLVGHSFGAWLVARSLAGLNPETTRAVLIAGMPGITNEHRINYRQTARDLRNETISKQHFFGAVLSLMLSSAEPSDEDTERIRRLIESMGLQRIGVLLGLAAHLADPRYRVTPFDVPTDIVHAENDKAMPTEYADELARLGSRARRHTRIGDSHAPHWHQPEASASFVFA